MYDHNISLELPAPFILWLPMYLYCVLAIYVIAMKINKNIYSLKFIVIPTTITYIEIQTYKWSCVVIIKWLQLVFFDLATKCTK